MPELINWYDKDTHLPSGLASTHHSARFRRI